MYWHSHLLAGSTLIINGTSNITEDSTMVELCLTMFGLEREERKIMVEVMLNRTSSTFATSSKCNQ